MSEAERESIDWSLFLEKARENGTSAVVYFNLNRIKRDLLRIPSLTFEQMKKDYYLNAARNALIFEELAKVLQSFHRSGLQVIVLKGAVLAERVYQNLALRPMLDVDLLAKKEDLLYLDEQLNSLGYRPTDMSIDQVDLASNYLTSLDYRSSQKSPSFHLHWHFVNSTIPNESTIRKVRIENIWKEARRTTVAGVETLEMAPHHLLIHLSEHALRVTHSLNRLGLLCDIDRALNFYRGKLDWERLIEDCVEFNLTRMVYLSLSFTSRFFGTEIPESVLLKLKPGRFTLGEKFFMSSIAGNSHLPGSSYFVHLAMNKGFFRKAKFLLRTFFPPRKFIAQRNYIPLSEVSARHYLRRIGEVLSPLLKILK